MLTLGAVAAVFSCHKRDEERKKFADTLLDTACDGKGQADCQRPACVWCKSSAVPSACYTPVGVPWGSCIDMQLQPRAAILLRLFHTCLAGWKMSTADVYGAPMHMVARHTQAPHMLICTIELSCIHPCCHHAATADSQQSTASTMHATASHTISGPRRIQPAFDQPPPGPQTHPHPPPCPHATTGPGQASPRRRL
jgi:hypothetical protein